MHGATRESSMAMFRADMSVDEGGPGEFYQEEYPAAMVDLLSGAGMGQFEAPPHPAEFGGEFGEFALGQYGVGESPMAFDSVGGEVFLDPHSPNSDFYTNVPGHGDYFSAPASMSSPAQADSEVRTELNSLLEHAKEQERQIQVQTDCVREFYLNPGLEEYSRLNRLFDEWIAVIKGQTARLNTMRNECMLRPVDWEDLETLLLRFKVQEETLVILKAEVEAHNHREHAGPMAKLIIVKDPFPHAVRQHKALPQDRLIVRLIGGATASVVEIGPVQCIARSIGENSDQTDMLSSNVEKMEDNNAMFQLGFEQGSRKSLVNVVFSVDVHMQQLGLPPRTFRLESEPSRPFIIMTNQKQWESCHKLLFDHEVFGTNDAVQWHRFANYLQRHTLLASRQDFKEPARPLSPEDLSYIHHTGFNSQAVIDRGQAERFWKWYGRTEQVVRYQRHAMHMYLEGILYGYMSRERAESVLSGKPAGTFLLRFSQNHTGLCAIAYVSSEGEPRHYLVKEKETAGAKITLPDVLRKFPQLSQLLMYNGRTGQFDVVDKQKVLDEHYQKKVQRSVGNNASGYDDHIC